MLEDPKPGICFLHRAYFIHAYRVEQLVLEGKRNKLGSL